MGDFGGNGHTEFDEEFDTWTGEEEEKIPKSRKEANGGNRPTVKGSGGEANGRQAGRSQEEKRREEIEAAKRKRIVDGVIIKILAEIKRREEADKAQADSCVTIETRPELFDKNGTKLTFGSSKSNPGRH